MAEAVHGIAQTDIDSNQIYGKSRVFGILREIKVSAHRTAQGPFRRRQHLDPYRADTAAF
ncbi:MAG: hypothetical protein LBV50_10505 [Novosphingobium sp.]|jgi:hypothetical protein|nr:hypothetical protein [Novosphingobium sp.]